MKVFHGSDHIVKQPVYMGGRSDNDYVKAIKPEELYAKYYPLHETSLKNGKVSIPNQELMERFADMLQKEALELRKK